MLYTEHSFLTIATQKRIRRGEVGRSWWSQILGNHSILETILDHCHGYPLMCGMLQHLLEVTQQVRTINTRSCNVCDVVQLLYDNDGRAGNLVCHNVPPSVNEANNLLLDSA
jgi:hypothetical protein